MATYAGQLNSNEIFSAIYNMIISQEVFADNIGKHQTLVDAARVDGGLFGDTKLYYSTDVLASKAWANYGTGAIADTNLLIPHRPADPYCQEIELNQFRQIALTIDNYLTKRAWANEGAFAQFNAVMLGWMGETKKIYEGTLYNCFIGTTITTTGKQSQTVTLSGTNDGQTLAKKIADILVEMGDYSRDFNDLGYLRSYADADIDIIWNAEFVNKITKEDTPTIFHKDGLVDKLDKYALPAKYFGTVITNTNKDTYADNTPTAGKPLDKDGNYAYTPGTANANGCVRTLVECDVKVNNVDYHLFPGMEIPVGTKLATTAAAGTLLFGQVYIEDPKVICKIVTKLPPIMSAFEVGTSFFNPQNLSENHYLTWGYNTLAYFVDKPFITLKKA